MSEKPIKLHWNKEELRRYTNSTMCGEFGYTLQEKKYAEFNLETGLRMAKIMELMSFIFELQLCKAIIERSKKM